VEAVQEKNLALVAAVKKGQGKYRLVENKPGEPLKIGNWVRLPKRYLRQTSSAIELMENETYYLF
jgi:hypothetical protein